MLITACVIYILLQVLESHIFVVVVQNYNSQTSCGIMLNISEYKKREALKGTKRYECISTRGVGHIPITEYSMPSLHVKIQQEKRSGCKELTQLAHEAGVSKWWPWKSVGAVEHICFQLSPLWIFSRCCSKRWAQSVVAERRKTNISYTKTWSLCSASLYSECKQSFGSNYGK